LTSQQTQTRRRVVVAKPPRENVLSAVFVAAAICMIAVGMLYFGLRAVSERTSTKTPAPAASQAPSETALTTASPPTVVELLTLSLGSNVNSVALSPDGTRIVTGSVFGAARVWDAQSDRRKELLSLHSFSVSSVAFSPDGARIVTGSFDATAKVWDAQSGKELLTLK